MSSYILKNNKEEYKVLLYQEKASYTFSPKKGYNEVKKITILDPNMLNTLWKHKIDKEYLILSNDELIDILEHSVDMGYIFCYFS